MSTPRADRLLGLPLTIFRGMWLVFETLNHRYHTLRPYQIFINTDGAFAKIMNHNHNPARHPYSGCKNVNIATPIKLASDRESLNFYRSY
jgi:hypothetical protein